MIDLDELERLYKEGATQGDFLDWYKAIKPVAPELIAMARQADEIHTAICSAVSHLNICPELARSENGRTAHLILRQALIDYADAMQEQKR